MWRSWSLSSYHARSELLCPLNADQTTLTFSGFFCFHQGRNFFLCWHVGCQHSLFSTTSGNMLTPEIYKNCPPRVYDCNPAEVPQVWSLLLQFYSCQNSQAGYQFHALPRINYERPDISCAGFTKLVRLYPKLCSFQRNIQPFHRVKESSITISWFERYKFWNFLFKCWTTG
jgi:hypothetical protein